MGSAAGSAGWLTGAAAPSLGRIERFAAREGVRF
jgi:hypothetical protein